MPKYAFFFAILILFPFVFWLRYREASRLIEKWLNDNKYLTCTSFENYHQSISVLVWPVEAKIVTRNSSGILVKLDFLVGQKPFGGFFNKKIICVSIKNVDE